MLKPIYQCKAIILAVLIAVSATALTAKSDAIQQLINRQIAAFKADDFPLAFSFASPVIQDRFGTPEQFGQMVRRGYPMVYRPSRVDFLDVIETPTRSIQRVMITDEAGVTFLLDYEMVQISGEWRINGVMVVRLPEVNT
ncbi:MAG: DUF4864 domain-containing protein [Aestuariivita sp.]|nr:DUF4864 domain-containing protein [Aestuariivita sp.]MCY4201360.1 DUF4864 domain-containing protein [Aestuariivita sp.]MCY4288132.1 DUF4864 domain-containing protein [Aestuariivita sp.]MCY4346302.1 DUF4864 domain-containing protein [Aestuariivita sp.]